MQSVAREVVRYFFRFLLVYWICFMFPFPLDLLGLPLQLVEGENQPAWMQGAGAKYGEGYSWLTTTKNDACKWVGDRVLHVEVINQLTGSGDTMRGYVGCLCAVVISAVAALLWTMLVLLLRPRQPDAHPGGAMVSEKAGTRSGLEQWRPDRHPDRRLYGTVRVLVRFFLCQMLFSYGFAKVIPLQFAQPSSFRLAQQLGDMSPMGLLWTFMGFSAPFQIFTGAVEVLAGILLTARRTTLLGGLVALAAMTHVFVLNMCFDVPVKLYSFNYLVMAFFVIAPDLPRLANALVLGKAVEARPFKPLLGSVNLDRVVVVFRTLVVVGMVFGQIRGSYKLWNDMYGGPPAPIAGRWDLVSMQIDQQEPDRDDPMTWRWLDFTSRKFMRLAGPKPPNAFYSITWNAEGKKLILTKFRATDWSATFSYEQPEADALELRGSIDGKAISASLKRAPDKQYELMTRGFHWIQELPYNR